MLKRFPRLSETFVLHELLALQETETLLVDALLPPEDGPRHPELDRLRASVRYLPRRPRLRHLPIGRAHLRLAVRHPLRWLLLARRARRERTWRRFLQAGLTADRIRQERVRHVHAHFATAAAEVARDAAQLVGVPYTVTAHAKDIFHHDNARKLSRRLRGAAAVVTISEFNCTHLSEALPGLPVHHIPNGIRAAPLAAIPRHGPVLCVTRLVPKKGIDVLIQACALLATDLPHLRVAIIGSGELGEELEQLAADLAVADRISFQGALHSQEVHSALERCSMFVLPCRQTSDGDRDGIPTSLLEAMSHGVPVISTAVSGIPEVVHDDQSGLLVPPDDASALAAAIRRIDGDRVLAARLGRHGRALVVERFDPELSARKLEAVFACPGLS